MREMLEMGLNLENCEIWLERAVFAIVAIMLVVTLVRVRSVPLHFSPGYSALCSASLPVRGVALLLPANQASFLPPPSLSPATHPSCHHINPKSYYRS